MVRFACVGISATLNYVLEIGQHPILNSEDIFTSLAGGQLFTTLDMSQAYQQLVLEEEYKELVTVSCYTDCLESNAIFMIAFSSNKDERLANLAKVLKWLCDERFCLKRDKCHCMQPSVEYLGQSLMPMECTLLQANS